MRAHRPIVHLIIVAMLLTAIPLLQPVEAEQTSSALLASTYLQSPGCDYGTCITTDSQGNIIIAGKTNSSGFPITAGAYSTSHHNPGNINWGDFFDIFVVKMNPAGTELIFSTFLGGLASDIPYGIAVDGDDNIYVTGITYSLDFPVTSMFTSTRGWGETFVSKIDPTGSTLLYSVLLGGSEWDEGRDISVDQSGNAYVFGETNSPDFYLGTAATNIYSSTYSESSDTFIAKINPQGTEMPFFTYLGGVSTDEAGGIDADNSGHVYVTGNTHSVGFPTASAYDSTYNSYMLVGTEPDTEPFFFEDAFVSKFDTTMNGASSLVYSTFFGGLYDDRGTDICVDGSGQAYVLGEAVGGDGFPTTIGAFDRQGRNCYQDLYYPTSDVNCFMMKLGSDGIQLEYSTLIPGISHAAEVALSQNGDVVASGYTYNQTFPITSDAFSNVFEGASDLFLMVLRTDGLEDSDLIYSTVIGGSDVDVLNGMCADGFGNAIMTGSTSSPNLPIRPLTGAYQSVLFNDNPKAFVMKFQIGGGTPTGPQSVNAVGGSSSIDISWTAPASDGGSPITGYNVYRRTGTTSDKVLLTATPLASTARNYHDTAVQSGIEFVYSVRSINANGVGEISMEANASLIPMQDLQPPGQILDLRSTAGTGSISLFWTPHSSGGSPIIGYNVYRTQGGVESKLNSALLASSSTTYVDTTAQSGTEYSYRITAVNSNGESARSNEAANQIGRGPTVPGAPTGLRTTPGPNNITVRWTPPADPGTSPIEKFRIYVGTASGQGQAVGNISGDSTSVIVSGIPLGATRYFQVTAVNSVGESARSGEVSASTISAPSTPAPPSALNATIQDGKAILTWALPTSDGGSEIASYKVFKGTKSDGSDAALLFVVQDGNATSFVDSTYSEGQPAYYQVYAVNAQGQSALAAKATLGAVTGDTSSEDLPILLIAIVAGLLVAVVLVVVLVVRKRNRSTGSWNEQTGQTRYGQGPTTGSVPASGVTYCPFCGSQTQGAGFCGNCGKRQP